MKKLVVALAFLLFVTAGAIGVLKWLGVGPFELDESANTTEQTTSSRDRETPYFVEMDPVLVPLFRDDKVAATIQIHIQLEVIGSDVSEEVLFARPRLGSAFFQDLYGYIPRMLMNSDRIDMDILKKRLKFIADKTLGEGKVSDVLIQSVNEVRAP